jgi:hypothetical protein
VEESAGNKSASVEELGVEVFVVFEDELPG